MKPTAIQTRIDKLTTRIRDSVCPHTIAALVRRMTADLDPEAIPALLGLLAHKHDARASVSKALLRYGESAEEPLRAHVAANPSADGAALLDCLLYRARLRELGCF